MSAAVTGPLSATHLDNAIKALTALKHVLRHPSSESTLDRFAKKRVNGTRLTDDNKALVVPLAGVFGYQGLGGEVTFALTGGREPHGDFSESEGDGEGAPSDAEGSESEEDDASEDESDDGRGKKVKKSTPVSEARGVFQSRQVRDCVPYEPTPCALTRPLSRGVWGVYPGDGSHLGRRSASAKT